MTDVQPQLTQDIAASLAWWSAAGVDYDYADDATAWLSADAPEAAQNSARSPQAKAGKPTDTIEKPPEKIDLFDGKPPQDLAEFREFWLSAPGLDPIGPRGRVPPRGPENAKLMVLVVDPEEGDSETLLSGPQGRLLANILTAMNTDKEQVYFASALTRHTPMADTHAAAKAGMAQILHHHVNLVAPERLIAFGANISPLLLHDVTKVALHLRENNQKPSSRSPLMSDGLDAMMAMPRLKARFWRRLIEWSAQR